uniref:Uncharacterized protein n=1 Tax=Sphaerodactylus townsendi TaxID=933632 RepID=A0ACB8EW30_9SAUR
MEGVVGEGNPGSQSSCSKCGVPTAFGEQGPFPVTCGAQAGQSLSPVCCKFHGVYIHIFFIIEFATNVLAECVFVFHSSTPYPKYDRLLPAGIWEWFLYSVLFLPLIIGRWGTFRTQRSPRYS